MKRFTEAPEKLAFIFDGPKVTLDEKSVKKNLLKEGCRADEVLAEVRAILADESIEWRATRCKTLVVNSPKSST